MWKKNYKGKSIFVIEYKPKNDLYYRGKTLLTLNLNFELILPYEVMNTNITHTFFTLIPKNATSIFMQVNLSANIFRLRLVGEGGKHYFKFKLFGSKREKKVKE